jgi:hypothetical protein
MPYPIPLSNTQNKKHSTVNPSEPLVQLSAYNRNKEMLSLE